MAKKKQKYIMLSMAYAVFFLGVTALYWQVETAPRYPAAINNDFQIEDNSVAKALLSGASVKLSEGNYDLNFKSMGQACDAYNRINIEFISPDIRTSGQIPSMQIEMDCIKSAGGTLQVQIPYQTIMQERPGEIDLMLNSPQAMRVRVSDIIGFWPEYWVVSKVSLVNSSTNQVLVISEKEVSKITNNSLSMRWK